MPDSTNGQLQEAAGLDFSFRKVSSPPLSWNLNGFYFDAWLRLNHNTSLTITQHPVEMGASISDHSYINPKRFSFDIGMTDVAQSPPIPGKSARSINAYQALVQMQGARIPLTLVSKYGTTDNVLIEGIDASDDFRSQEALRATITLLQIIVVDTKLLKTSSNPHATDKTVRGQVAPKVPSRPALDSFETQSFSAD